MDGGWSRLNSNWISRSVGSRTKACGTLLRGERRPLDRPPSHVRHMSTYQHTCRKTLSDISVFTLRGFLADSCLEMF